MKGGAGERGTHGAGKATRSRGLEGIRASLDLMLGELLFSNEWLSGERGWEKSIQAVCFKDISVSSWDLWSHLFSAL